MAVKVIIHPGKKSEEEFKEAVERYVRKWIFTEKGEAYAESKTKAMGSTYIGSDCNINNNAIINA